MNVRVKYHTSILGEGIGYVNNNIKFDNSYRSSDNMELRSTLFGSSSDIGIMIIPGWASPREKYYKFASDLNKNFKVMVYDQRGHGYSQGNFNINLMADDVITVADQYLKQENIKKLYIVGHSFGAYVSAIASLKIKNDRIAAQILLSVPISLKTTAEKVPSNISTFQIYLMNILKTTNPRNRGRIFREYFSFWYPKFKKNPYLMGYRVDNVNEVINQFKNSVHLSNIADQIKLKTLFLWGSNDEKLKLNSVGASNYQSFIDQYIAKNSILKNDILLGISHYLNVDGRNTVFWAGDNELVKNKISNWINVN